MKHECKYSEKINAYIDGELSKKEFSKMKNHLTECLSCQTELREAINLNRYLSEYENVEVPDHINEKILNQIKEIQISRIPFTRRLTKLSIAASIIFAFILGITASNNIFSSDNSSEIEFGSETLYSFFEGGQ